MRSLLAFAAAAALFTASATASSAEPDCNGDCEATPVSVPPAETGDTLAPTRMRSGPVFATGLVLDIIGTAAVVTGAGFLASGPDCNYPLENAAASASCGAARFSVDFVGVVALAGGALFLAVGIPLTFVGAARVPDVERARDRDARPRAPTLRVGAGGGGLEWKF